MDNVYFIGSMKEVVIGIIHVTRIYVSLVHAVQGFTEQTRGQSTKQHLTMGLGS